MFRLNYFGQLINMYIQIGAKTIVRHLISVKNSKAVTLSRRETLGWLTLCVRIIFRLSVIVHAHRRIKQHINFSGKASCQWSTSYLLQRDRQHLPTKSLRKIYGDFQETSHGNFNPLRHTFTRYNTHVEQLTL